jgi:prevent-host-death family protein
MGTTHAARSLPALTGRAILLREVSVLRADNAKPRNQPRPLGIATCAARFAPKPGQDAAARVMETRIRERRASRVHSAMGAYPRRLDLRDLRQRPCPHRSHLPTGTQGIGRRLPVDGLRHLRLVAGAALSIRPPSPRTCAAGFCGSPRPCRRAVASSRRRPRSRSPGTPGWKGFALQLAFPQTSLNHRKLVNHGVAMAIQVNIHEAKTQLSRLITRACRGEDVVIAKAGHPLVRLTPIERQPSGRRFGALRGKAKVDGRFFEPLPENELRAWE